MFPVLFSHGAIGAQESALMIQATLLMLIVIVPVLGLLFFFAWYYRAGGTARYEPNWEHSVLDELVWWAVPLEIVLVLAALTWSSTHRLDPHKALATEVPAVQVEVVALPWKWLFIYPQYGISTVNYLVIPAGAPVDFAITADAPMNSFWIPALGGQIYAMTGMVNPLHLVADTPGIYEGLSANYSGEGFAGMRFKVMATSSDAFLAWAAQTAHATPALSLASYQTLARPGTTTLMTFGTTDKNLFNAILSTFDFPGLGHNH